MKNKVLGSLGIKIIVWIVLSVSSFSFLIGFYGLALSSSSRQQEHVNQTSYFSTYEANYGIQTEVKAFLSEMPHRRICSICSKKIKTPHIMQVIQYLQSVLRHYIRS